MLGETFQFLTENDRKLVFSVAQRQTYRRGQALYHEGDAQPNLYMVQRGLVRVERKYHDQSITVARFGPGEILGEISYLTQRTALGSVFAEEDVEVDILDGQRLQAMLASDPGCASRFYLSLARRLAERLIQITPGMQLSKKFRESRRPRQSRVGQLSARQLRPELVDGVESFKNEMHQVAVGLKNRETSAPMKQGTINAHCDALVALLDKFTREGELRDIGMDDLLNFRDISDLARGIGGYVFRETFSIFMQSATIARGYEKPKGYAEELLERIERDEPEGDGQLGPLIDKWFLDSPFCRSRVNSLHQMTAILQAEIARAKGPGPVRLTSLAAGTAQEIFDLQVGDSTSFYVTCLDRDPDMILVNANRAREVGFEDRITFLDADLGAMIRNHRFDTFGPQHVVYALGLCDYLGDDQFVELLATIHDLLIGGGCAVLTNRDAESATRAVTEHILDWPVIHRTEKEIVGLFGKSKFAGSKVEILRESAGVNIFAKCRKG